MLIALKLLHFLALLLGGAAAVTSLILPRALSRSGHEGPPPPALKLVSRALAILGLIAIIILWITGLILWRTQYPGVALGPWFIVKLCAAGTILTASLWANLHMARATRLGKPPKPKRLQRLGSVSRFFLIVALVAAVMTFSGG